MTRDELIAIGERIVQGDGSEEEIDQLVMLFDSNVPYPNGSNLFFYPENYNARNNKLSDYMPAVEDVVDKCLAYRPIILPINDGRA